jgi:signal transduction histidine kinase
MSGTGYRLVLLIGLLGAAAVGWLSWRSTRSASARVVWLGAVSVLGCLGVWFLFGGLARLAGLDPRLWAAPLDRLLGVALLVTLGWTLGAPGLAGRRWRVFLACGLAAATLAYLGWAPTWAQAFQRDPGLVYDATGLARVWDVWLLVLALAVGIAVLRAPRTPRWALAVVAGLGLGAFLELIVPLSATVPAWSRLGTLVAGGFLVAAAATQAGELWPVTLTAPGRLQRYRTPGKQASRPSAPPAAATAAVTAAAASSPVAAADPLDRVLGELDRQGQTLTGLTLAIDGLSGRLDALERSNEVGEPAMPATPDAVTAPVAAATLVESETVPSTSLDRDLTVAAIAALEGRQGMTPARVAPPAREAASPATDPALFARAARYEQAIAQLPWGVVVADADDCVAVANATAGHLLHIRSPQPGQPVASLFPSHERIGYALHQARRRELAVDGALEVEFDSPSLRVEVAPLMDPVVGYLGTVLVLHNRSTAVDGVTGALVPALAEALRAPMTSILGYSELLNRMTSLSEDQVQRFLQRIDANLSRMQVMLGNLLTVMSLLESDTPRAMEAVDVEAAVRGAVDRALPQFGEKGLVVNVAVDSPLPTASADPRAFTQIMDNLLAQAALRSPQGGDVTVEAAARDDGAGQRAVVISVRDRGNPLAGAGSGMVEIDEGASRQVALTVVRLLAERQGGRAWAESDARGARFHVRLPVRRAA